MSDTGTLPAEYVLRGRYRVVRKVGKGGMARVYQAMDTKNHMTVAVKEMLHPQWMGEQQLQEAEEQFQKEAAILKSLTHRHLPRFYDYFSENGRFYLVMEFVHGETLDAWLANVPTHQISVEDVVKYAIQLCEVLVFLHTRKPPIIFRDLKTSNIMITPGGDLMLIDFGIARFFKPGQEADTLWAGSFGFSPPELILDNKTEPRSDLYSLGATLHFCLTGRHPASDRQKLFSFPSVRDYNKQVPVNLDNFILQLLATNVDARPASAEVALRELKEIQHNALSPTEYVGNRSQVDHAMGSYYNPKKAQIAQLKVGLWQLSKLPGLLGWLWSLFSPFCLKVGIFVLSIFFNHLLPFSNKVGQVVLLTEQRKRWQKRHQIQQTARPAPRNRQQYQQPQRGRLALQELPQFIPLLAIPESVMHKIFPHPPVSSQTQEQGLPHIWTWLTLLALTSLGGVWLLSGLHSPLDIIILVLSLFLLFLTLGANTIWNVHLLDLGASYWNRYNLHKSDAQNQMISYLLATTALLLFVLCLVLLMQSDVQRVIASSTLGEALGVVLVGLGLAALSRPAAYLRWIDHIAVACIAAACAVLQYSIKLPIPFLTENTASSINIVVIVIMGLVAFCSLCRLDSHCSFVDRVLILIIALVYAIQQGLLGTPETLGLPYLHTLTLSEGSMPLLVANLLFALLPLAVAVWVLYASADSFLARLSLPMLAVFYALLLWFQGSATLLPALFSAQPIYTLATMLMAMISSNLVLTWCFALLAVMTGLRLFARSRFPQWDYVTLFALAFCYGLLELSIWGQQARTSGPSVSISLYIPASNILLSLLLLFVLVVSLVLTALSLFLHLAVSVKRMTGTVGQGQNSRQWHLEYTFSAIVPRLDRVVIHLGQVMLVVSTVICAFLQGILGTEESFYDQGSLEVYPGVVLSLRHYLLAILVLLAVSAGVWLWYVLRRHADTDDSVHKRPFSAWVRLLVFVNAVAAMFLLSGRLGQQSLYLVPSFPIIPLWPCLLLLLVVVVVQLLCLLYPFAGPVRWLLHALLIGALLCALLQFFFPYVTIVTLILLIQSIVLTIQGVRVPRQGALEA